MGNVAGFECGNCERVVTAEVELWWGESSETQPRVIFCPLCDAWNVVTFALRMDVKVLGIVTNKGD